LGNRITACLFPEKWYAAHKRQAGSSGTRTKPPPIAPAFELDFWGRNRALRDTALFTLAASAFDRDTVRLTVTAGVARTWLSAMALRERIGIAESNLSSAERLLTLVESRIRAGIASPLERAQACPKWGLRQTPVAPRHGLDPGFAARDLSIAPVRSVRLLEIVRR
jgi:hypothetical protein